MKVKWVPVVIEDACSGCGLCIEACGPKCLELENRVAGLPRPDDCGSEEHCISVCPEDAIHMRWVPIEGNSKFGLWRESEEMEGQFVSAMRGTQEAAVAASSRRNS